MYISVVVSLGHVAYARVYPARAVHGCHAQSCISCSCYRTLVPADTSIRHALLSVVLLHRALTKLNVCAILIPSRYLQGKVCRFIECTACSSFSLKRVAKSMHREFTRQDTTHGAFIFSSVFTQ